MSSYKRFIVNYDNSHRFLLDYKAGEIINGLEIVQYIGYTCEPNGSHPMQYYRVRCLSCDNIYICNTQYIKWFGNRMCICNDKANIDRSWYTNLLSNTKLYSVWYNTYQKCTNPDNHEYNKYGAKGIFICDEWSGKDGFINFFNWALENGYDGQSKYATLRRIDNNKGFSPDNCVLSCNIESYNNKSNNNEIIWRGIKYTTTELCDHFGLDRSRVYDRLYSGKSIEESVLMPKTRTGSAGKIDRIEFMNNHPLIVDGDRIVQNPNAINPFVSTKYPEIDTNDPELLYRSEEKIAQLRGILPVEEETDEEYQKAREEAKQSLIKYINNKE